MKKNIRGKVSQKASNIIKIANKPKRVDRLIVITETPKIHIINIFSGND